MIASRPYVHHFPHFFDIDGVAIHRAAVTRWIV
jgi:hypothetical protein